MVWLTIRSSITRLANLFCPGSWRKAQGAIEFALMFGVMLFFFLGVLAYLNFSLGKVSQTTEISKNNAELQRFYDVIFEAWRSPTGYVTTLEYFPFDPETDRSLFFQSDITGRVREVVAIDQLGNQQLFFFPKTMTFVADVCSGTNELTKTNDGVGFCCGTCDGTLPGKSRDNTIFCQQNYSVYGKLGYFQDCDAMQKIENQENVILHAVQVVCPYSGYVNITIDSGGDLYSEQLLFNASSDVFVDIPVYDEVADEVVTLSGNVDILAECYRKVTTNEFVLDRINSYDWTIS